MPRDVQLILVSIAIGVALAVLCWLLWTQYQRKHTGIVVAKQIDTSPLGDVWLLANPETHVVMLIAFKSRDQASRYLAAALPNLPVQFDVASWMRDNWFTITK